MKQMQRWGILGILLCCAGAAQAGMYRCGNTFSDKPCAGEGRELKHYASGSTAGSDGQSPLNLGGKLCSDSLLERFDFKDPDSVKIGAASGGQLDIIDYAGKKLAARAYRINANAKNEYGAYTGNQPYLCHTSEDGRRILQFRRGS